MRQTDRGRGCLLLCVLAIVACVITGCSGSHSGPLRIGVMLPLTGPNAYRARGPLEWARQNINAAGGVDGRRIEFVYRDVYRQSPLAVARSFASDSSIAAVIGPSTSEDVIRVAPVFIKAHKVIVTPAATSASLFRAFGSDRPQYLWRPLESDIAQMRVMLEVAKQDGARSVALVTGNSVYGGTFFDAFGFLATEDGLRVTATIRYREEAQGCRGPVDQALSSGADVVLAVPDHAPQAICMARRWRAHGSRPRLLLSDSAQKQSLIAALGARAQGIEGIGLAPDPSSRFAPAFEARFHRPPSPYAANLYDSVLMVAYGLERSGGEGGSALAEAIRTITSGRGPAVGWNRSAVAKTLRAIGAGRTPAIHGAVGPWEFDKTDGMDLVASTYELWRVNGSHFQVARYLSTDSAPTARNGISEADASATTQGKPVTTGGGGYRPGPKTGTWALLVAASDGWENYRHQADVFAQYQRLRAGGVPADHIIVVSPDDMARNSHNPDPGRMPYVVDGPNLDRGVHVDYPLRGMTAERLMAILEGHASPSTPKVIRSGPGTDVFVYIAGHGNENGVYLGLGEPVPSLNGSYSILTPQLLDQTIAAMASDHRYRRILLAVEACESGVLGSHLDAPGALLLSAADPVEDSLSTNYDPTLKTWLADEFSYQLYQAEGATPEISLDDLYQRLYLRVPGSHVSAYGPRFGNAATVSLREFLTP